MSLSKGDQLKLGMEHVVKCPCCGGVFPEIDVHPDDQLCIKCEAEWVSFCKEWDDLRGALFPLLPRRRPPSADWELDTNERVQESTTTH